MPESITATVTPAPWSGLVDSRLVDAERPAQRVGGVECRAQEIGDQAVALHRAVVRDVQARRFPRPACAAACATACPTRRRPYRSRACNLRPFSCSLRSALAFVPGFNVTITLSSASPPASACSLEVSVQLLAPCRGVRDRRPRRRRALGAAGPPPSADAANARPCASRSRRPGFRTLPLSPLSSRHTRLRTMRRPIREQPRGQLRRKSSSG